MADWDEDSPELRANLTAVLESVADSAAKREKITLAAIKRWHKATMKGLDVPSPASVGNFRGEAGLENCRVGVGNAFFNLPGAEPGQVAAETRAFITKLTKSLDALDNMFAPNADLGRDGFMAITEVAGWAHAEWVRIHPFRNGNGRTARILANAILMRYGLPPAVRLRPRPGGDYGSASGRAMVGDQQPTITVVRAMVIEQLRGPQRNDGGEISE